MLAKDQGNISTQALPALCPHRPAVPVAKRPPKKVVGLNMQVEAKIQRSQKRDAQEMLKGCWEMWLEH